MVSTSEADLIIIEKMSKFWINTYEAEYCTHVYSHFPHRR